MHSRTSQLVAGVVIAVGSMACSTEEIAAPLPNPDITNSQGTLTLPRVVECEGPDDELAILGPLCGHETELEGWQGTTGGGAGMGMALGPRGGPLLLIYNEVPESPESDSNVADELRHAVFFWPDDRVGDVYTTGELWSKADAEEIASGTVVTESARFDACSATWIAEAVLSWRNTTISLSWTAAQGC